MNWTIKYLEVYCEGKLVRRVSVPFNGGNKTRRKEKYNALLKEVTKAAKLSDKIYWIDLKVE